MQNSCTVNRFLLLFGSQTGQAQAISEELRDRVKILGLHPDFQCMQGVDKNFSLERETLAVFVISTTGDGEPPDTARKLLRRLNKRTLTKDFLKNLSYCLLGLGDSNYLNFCNCGKQFDKRLRELGASPFQETVYADDSVGLEVEAEPWIDRTIEYLLNFFKIEAQVMANNNLNMSTTSGELASNFTLTHSNLLKDTELNLPPLPDSYINIEYKPEITLSTDSVPVQNNMTFPSSSSEIIPAKIVKAKQLTKSASVKQYMEFTIKLSASNCDYEPGDAFGVVPQNDFTEVESILTVLNLLQVADTPCFLTSKQNDRVIPNHLSLQGTLRIYFTTCCDIRSPPKKILLRTMAEHTTDLKEKRRLSELCSRQGSAEFMKLIRSDKLGILDLLQAFPSCNAIPVTVFLEHLPRLQARYYSVANSPLEDVHQIRTVFSIVKFNVGSDTDNLRYGVCTKYLRQCAESLLVHNESDVLESLTCNMKDLQIGNPTELLVFKRKSSNFLLPEDHTIPLIMIGPGAGVAPFLGFLRHRNKLKKSGKEGFGETWLYYGCRHRLHDFLFEEEFKFLSAEGILNHFRTSFSRDEESSSRYVQDNIREDIVPLLNLIETENALVFVCGDAKNMAKDVAKVFIEGYEKMNSVTRKEAEEWHLCLQKRKCYLQDIWL